MANDQREIPRKLHILQYAEKIGSVAKTLGILKSEGCKGDTAALAVGRCHNFN